MRQLKELLSDKSHLIWDFNGTIIDDAHLCVRAVNVLLSEHQLPQINVKRYAEVFDFPVHDYYLKLGFDYSKESFADLSHRFHELYHQWLPEASVFDGVRDALEELGHVEHHVLSAAQQDDLQRMLSHFDLRQHFTSVYGLGDRLATSKIENGLKLLRDQKIEPATCLMIGDTTHDLEVAMAMGIDVYLMAGGHQDESRLRNKTSRILKRS